MTTIRLLYDLTAPAYERHIAPVMRVFAADLIAAADLPTDGVGLDLGTGTGVLARLLADHMAHVIGMDRVYSMLRIARSLRGWRTVHYLHADAEKPLPLRAGSIDTAFASFGLDECHPARALRAAAHVLKPGGALALQTWGPLDGATDPRAIVDSTLAEFVTTDTDPTRARFREQIAAPSPWASRLQDTEDYTEALGRAGFTGITATESRPVSVHFSDAAAFLDYTLAWAPRRLEVEALPTADQARFRRDTLDKLRRLCAADGDLNWQPVIFRACCVRKF